MLLLSLTGFITLYNFKNHRFILKIFQIFFLKYEFVLDFSFLSERFKERIRLFEETRNGHGWFKLLNKFRRFFVGKEMVAHRNKKHILFAEFLDHFRLKPSGNMSEKNKTQ